MDFKKSSEHFKCMGQEIAAFILLYYFLDLLKILQTAPDLPQGVSTVTNTNKKQKQETSTRP